MLNYNKQEEISANKIAINIQKDDYLKDIEGNLKKSKIQKFFQDFYDINTTFELFVTQYYRGMIQPSMPDNKFTTRYSNWNAFGKLNFDGQNKTKIVIRFSPFAMRAENKYTKYIDFVFINRFIYINTRTLSLTAITNLLTDSSKLLLLDSLYFILRAGTVSVYGLYYIGKKIRGALLMYKDFNIGVLVPGLHFIIPIKDYYIESGLYMGKNLQQKSFAQSFIRVMDNNHFVIELEYRFFSDWIQKHKCHIRCALDILGFLNVELYSGRLFIMLILKHKKIKVGIYLIYMFIYFSLFYNIFKNHFLIVLGIYASYNVQRIQETKQFFFTKCNDIYN